MENEKGVCERMLVVLTGKPSSGKTTSVEMIIERLGGVGFLTREVREGKRRIGFVIETSWGEKLWLARVGYDSKFRVGRYGVFIDNVDKVSRKLRDLLKASKLVYIDEIGKMEMKSKEFEGLVEEILKMKVDSILTIPIVDFHPIVARIRKEADLLIDAEDYWNRRDELVEIVLERIEGKRNG